ncbi:MAG: NAD(P)H-hydrate dehydratase [Prevotella sp.]|nr:NAD(P)H-hydrate dehydratase [Prevotella sp.]
MKIFTGNQIHDLDQYTIDNEPIKSIDLMERAARAMTAAIEEQWGQQTPVTVFAGPGNNGGDALAVARLLLEKQYEVQTYIFNVNGKLSADCHTNLKRLREKWGRTVNEVVQEFDPPQLGADMLVVDGLFGSGLNKPLAGGFATLVKYINASEAQVVSLDMPSGLMTEDNTYNVRPNIIRATLTLTLQQPKLAMLFAENQEYLGRVRTLDIHLSQQGIDSIDAQYTLTDNMQMAQMLRPRNRFAHKGDMGHAMLVAGCYGMAGAAVLAAKACLRAGVGKLTVVTPRQNVGILQTTVPEAVLRIDRDETAFCEAVGTDGYNAIGIGPGLGTQEQTAVATIAQIRRSTAPIVVDADALNILSTHLSWLQQLPHGVVLTPHPKELDRIEGHCTNSYERLTKAKLLAERLSGYVILKGHHTATCLPDGHVVFNSTGNAGMATAGSGDVLTGILTALIARGYNTADACVLGVYLHGLAGDMAARELGEESLTASDIVRYLPKAFLSLMEQKHKA